jgi:hypothetical protein
VTVNKALSPQAARYLVLGPTLVLSIVLAGFGLRIMPRVALCLAFGAVLILLVARYQRRGMF